MSILGKLLSKLIPLVMLAGCVYAAFFLYHHFLIETADFYAPVKRSKPEFGRFMFETDRYNVRYFYENFDQLQDLVKSPAINELDAKDFFVYLTSVQAQNLDSFKKNAALFRLANTPLMERAFLTRSKNEKKTLGRFYKLLFGKEPDLPDSNIKKDMKLSEDDLPER